MILPKSILLGIACLGAVMLVLALLVRLMENSITFHPTGNLELNPADYGLDYREIRLTPGERGVTLHGWYFAPADGKAPVLLVCHGNAGNISHRLEWLVPFLRRGWGALLFDYRGYGLSTGKPTERGLYKDAETAYEFLAGTEGLEPRRIVIFGRSLGGAVGTWLAARKQCGRLVLEGTFTSGAAISRRIFGFIPLHLATRYRWNTARELEAVKAPVLILHGTSDSVVPFELGQDLVEIKPAGRKLEFVRVDGGDHLNLHLILGTGYYDTVERFVLSE